MGVVGGRGKFKWKYVVQEMKRAGASYEFSVIACQKKWEEMEEKDKKEERRRRKR